MCGIAGWNLKDAPNPHFVAAMAYGILERGYDSWGYFDGQTIRKDVGPIVEGIRAHDMLSKTAFVHTRQMTTGRVCKANSHPFDIGGIVGAHNGVIYNHFDVQKSNGRNLPVDSMHIFQHMTEEKPLTELEGYGAIEFCQNGTWYIGQCNNGALVCAKLKNGAGVIWASTEDCLRAAIFQGEYELDTYYTIENGHIYRVEVDCLYETDRQFNLSKKPELIKGLQFDSAKYQQENWWRKSDFEGSDTDLPTSFFGNGETITDECEFCNEYADLTELDGSLICDECRSILAPIIPRETFHGSNL